MTNTFINIGHNLHVKPKNASKTSSSKNSSSSFLDHLRKDDKKKKLTKKAHKQKEQIETLSFSALNMVAENIIAPKISKAKTGQHHQPASKLNAIDQHHRAVSKPDGSLLTIDHQNKSVSKLNGALPAIDQHHKSNYKPLTKDNKDIKYIDSPARDVPIAPHKVTSSAEPKQAQLPSKDIRQTKNGSRDLHYHSKNLPTAGMKFEAPIEASKVQTKPSVPFSFNYGKAMSSKLNAKKKDSSKPVAKKETPAVLDVKHAPSLGKHEEIHKPHAKAIAKQEAKNQDYSQVDYKSPMQDQELKLQNLQSPSSETFPSTPLKSFMETAAPATSEKLEDKQALAQISDIKFSQPKIVGTLQHMDITLKPEGLGKVTASMQLEEDKLVVEIKAENKDTARLLALNENLLKHSLHKQHVNEGKAIEIVITNPEEGKSVSATKTDSNTSFNDQQKSPEFNQNFNGQNSQTNHFERRFSKKTPYLDNIVENEEQIKDNGILDANKAQRSSDHRLII